MTLLLLMPRLALFFLIFVFSPLNASMQTATPSADMESRAKDQPTRAYTSVGRSPIYPSSWIDIAESLLPLELDEELPRLAAGPAV